MSQACLCDIKATLLSSAIFEFTELIMDDIEPTDAIKLRNDVASIIEFISYCLAEVKYRSGFFKHFL